jgi:hypothetical protein
LRKLLGATEAARESKPSAWPGVDKAYEGYFPNRDTDRARWKLGEEGPKEPWLLDHWFQEFFFFGELNQFTRAVGVVLAHCENEMFAFATHHTLTGRH